MLQAGSPLGPVCSVQASAFRKSASCPCVVCELACYRVVLAQSLDVPSQDLPQNSPMDGTSLDVDGLHGEVCQRVGH